MRETPYRSPSPPPRETTIRSPEPYAEAWREYRARWLAFLGLFLSWPFVALTCQSLLHTKTDFEPRVLLPVLAVMTVMMNIVGPGRFRCPRCSSRFTRWRYEGPFSALEHLAAQQCGTCGIPVGAAKRDVDTGPRLPPSPRD